MNIKFLKFAAILFCYAFAFGLHAEFVVGEEPAFTVDDEPWYLLTTGHSSDENIRIYGHHDSEESKTSAPEQALFVHVSNNNNALDSLHKEIKSVFPDARPTQIKSGDFFSIYQTHILDENSNNIAPKMVFITAVFNTESDVITVQYILKPKCLNCLRLEKEWIHRFEHAGLSADKTALILDEKNSIPVHPFMENFSSFNASNTATGFYPWISQYFTQLSVAGTTLLFYAGKIIMGIMGLYKCKRTGAPMCCCSENLAG